MLLFKWKPFGENVTLFKRLYIPSSLTWKTHSVNIHFKKCSCHNLLTSWFPEELQYNLISVHEVFHIPLTLELTVASGHNIVLKATERLAILGRNSWETSWRDIWWWLTQRRPFSLKWSLFWEGHLNATPLKVPPKELLMLRHTHIHSPDLFGFCVTSPQ